MLNSSCGHHLVFFLLSVYLESKAHNLMLGMCRVKCKSVREEIVFIVMQTKKFIMYIVNFLVIAKTNSLTLVREQNMT